MSTPLFLGQQLRFLLAFFILSSGVFAFAAGADPSLSTLNAPLAFEPNLGQTSAEAKSLAHGNGFAFFLTPSEALVRLSSNQNAPDPVLRLRWMGANPSPTVSHEQQLPGRVNYLRGDHRARWLSSLKTYKSVRLARVYQGIDLVFYGNHRQLEYDFILEPHADARQIRLTFEGARQVSVDKNGDLTLNLGDGVLRQHRPRIYQLVGGRRKRIEGSFVLAKGVTSFSIGDYDRTKPLIIDPVLSYATYLGGSATDEAKAVAVDGYGRAYVTGSSMSTDFPTKGGVQSTSRGDRDVFITKMWANGAGVLYSTYLGGSGSDVGTGIAVDGTGNAYVVGQSDSADFPANQLGPGGGSDAFAVKLNSSGNALLYAVKFGGSNFDAARAIAVDSAERLYATGETASVDFPTTAGAFDKALDSDIAAFVVRLNASGTAFSYATYFGGSGAQGRAIAVDTSGNAYITGYTGNAVPTTSGSFMPTPPNDPPPSCDVGCPYYSAFVTKLNSTGSGLVYSTYLGGGDHDFGAGIAVQNGYAYVTGETHSQNFPTTTGAFQRHLSGTANAFVTKLNQSGSALVYSTYLGGWGQDSGLSIAVNSQGHAHVAGYTTSPNFPVKNAVDGTFRGLDVGGFVVYKEGFVAKLWATGGGLHYSTFLGGSGGDSLARSVRLDNAGAAYVTGYTASPSLRTTTFQRSLKGFQNAFLVKIAP